MDRFEKDVLFGKIKPTEQEMFDHFYWRNYEKPALMELFGILFFFIFLFSVILLNQ